MRAVLPTHLTERLRAIEVSALCDADKTLPVCDAAIRAMVPGVRMAGPALTVTAEDDHLPVFSALAEAEPGEVLVIATNGGRLAVLGELFATEARRRGLAGVVIDGHCRDVHGLRGARAAGVRARHAARVGHARSRARRCARRCTAAASTSRPATSSSPTTTAW